MARPFVVIAALLVRCAHCAGVPLLLPDPRTPEDRARAIESKCAGVRELGAAAVLSPAAIDAVGPAYSYVHSGPGDREARLRGARIRIKPLSGVSMEAIERTVECHEARVVLGRDSTLANDPYVLAAHWLDIDVESDGDGFSVLVRTDQIDAARRVLGRARRYAARFDR